jgi:hypothetical protein
MNISRGRSRQLDRYDSGSATIVFLNSDRKLDPLNDDSSYQALIVPRIVFKIEADSEPIFSGVVKDWDIEYDLVGQDVAVSFCSDFFTILANLKFLEDVETLEQNCKERLEFVLNYFSISPDYSFDVGNANLGRYLIPKDLQVLDYFFNVSFSDQGNIFVSADNVLTFVGKYGREPVSELTFADDGTGIGYSSLTNEYGDELLFNKVSITSPESTKVSENLSSIASFGESTFVFNNALNRYEMDPAWIADSIIDRYGDPQVRFTGLAVELAGLSSSDQADVLALDLADQVSVKKSFSVGSPSSVTQDVIVTGVRHRIVPGSHVVEFTFEPTPYKIAFILDDNDEGELDDDSLG